jgi:glycosyltransferase involved in cell wall biosynthesis
MDKGQTPLVTIVVVTYHSDHLEQALNSLVDQTYSNLEVIMLDDHGPRETEEICQAFAKKHAHFTHIRNHKNIHYFRNFQKAFMLGKGKYIMAMADDDFMEPEFVEKCVDELEADETLVSCLSEVDVVFADGRRWEYWDVERLEDIPFDLFNSFEQMCEKLKLCMGFHSILRRSAVERVIPFVEDDRSFDATFLFELALYGGFKVIKEHLFNKRSAHESGERLRSQDDARGLATKSSLSQLHYFYPITYHVICTYRRIAQSWHDLETRKKLLEIFQEKYIPRVQKGLDDEAELTCDYLFRALREVEKDTNRVAKSYFMDNAIKALNDIILANPSARKPKQLIRLFTQKFITLQ